MRRIERGIQLDFSLLRLIVLLAHITTLHSLQYISQFSTDTASLRSINPLPEALNRGWYGLGLFNVVT